MALKVALVAGENSGDLLGGSLLHELRKLHPNLLAVGIGGANMHQAGCQLLYESKELAVMGFIEPLLRLPRLLSIRRALYKYLINYKPDVFIGIDAPDFNLDLALQLKQAGISTVHYVSPTVWAWRQYRLAKMARALDLMLTLFPFETQFYHAHRIPAQFVGHPLADQIPVVSDKSKSRQTLALPETGPILAVLPGSRNQELRHLGKVFLAAANLCRQSHSELVLVTNSINAEFDAQWRLLAQQYAPDLPLKFFIGRTQEVLTAADVALVTSGTVTLEAMLCKSPMVIAYRMATLNYYLAKMLVNTQFIGLPNLLAGKKLVPEFIQNEATAINLSQALLNYFNNPGVGTKLQAEFSLIHQQLAQQASCNAARVISNLVARQSIGINRD